MSIAEFLRPEAWLGQTAGPRYVQLRRRLEEGIETGVLAPNSSLPPERLAFAGHATSTVLYRVFQQMWSF